MTTEETMAAEQFAFQFSMERVSWVLTDDDLDHLEEAIAASAEVVFDLETTGLDEYAYTGGPLNGGVAARVVLVSFTLPAVQDEEEPRREPDTWVVPLSHPDSPFSGRWRKVLHRLAQAVVREDKGVIGHNVKFDCRWVHACAGVDLAHQVTWDTRISAHLLDENSSTRLKERAPATFAHLGLERWDDFDLTYPGAAEEVPLFDLGGYAARDTYWTWALSRVHRDMMFPAYEPMTPDEIEEARLGRLARWCAMPTIATLTEIEQRGMVLDTDWTKAELASHYEERDRLGYTLARRYPQMDPEKASFAPTSYWFREWAEQAVEAGDLIVAELTPTGKPKWSKNVLVRQARKGSEVAVDLLALRSHIKKIEYLSSWLDYQTQAGTIHATYNAGRVVTGRLSSEGPNMQQVTSTLKPAFVARPGMVLADLDYSQIELRVAAYVSQCHPMLAAFKRGDDLHTLLASRITGKPPGKVTKEERQAGKSANFGLLYGMSAFGFQLYAEDVYGVSFTRQEAHDVHRAFFEVWDGMAQWHARMILKAQQTGQVVSPIGRVRRVPDIFDGNPERAGYAERAAINAPVQGFASDLMQIAAASISGTLPGVSGVPGAHIVATVHDSIVVEVPADSWEQTTRACMERMVSVPQVLRNLGCEFDVPLTVEAQIGTRWGQTDVGELS
jgi:DNA polymerase-1